MPHYQEPLFRPPAEHASLIFQVAYGCPHNTCSFCQMYKGVRYQIRPIEDTLDEIEKSAFRYPDEKRIFLADGDVMALPFASLQQILVKLNQCFPRLARINVYANGNSILSKSKHELIELKNLKLSTLYLGLETGSDDLLRLVNKQETVDGMIDAVKKAQGNDLKCSVMALLGLGGKHLSTTHAEKTAKAINNMQPRLLSLLRFVEVGNTRMFDGYETLSEYDAVNELYQFVGKLELERTVFTANHASNPLPIKGRLPHDKQNLLKEIRTMLDSGLLDRDGPGRLPLWL